MLEYTEESKLPSPDTHNHNHHDDIPYDLVCTKYLGTLRTMAYSPARSASPAPVEAATAPLLPAASPTRQPPPPLNANVFRGPPSHHSLSPSSSHGGSNSNGSSPAGKPPLARFVLNTVGLLRVVAGALTIAVIVLQFAAVDRSYYRTNAPFFIFLAFVQLFWHLFALLVEECANRSRRHRRTRQLKIDLGFVTCIFGRPGRDEDGGAGGDEYVLMGGWVPGGERMGKWSKRSLLLSAIDFLVAWGTFAIALTADLGGSYIWGWVNYHEISILSFIIL